MPALKRCIEQIGPLSDQSVLTFLMASSAKEKGNFLFYIHLIHKFNCQEYIDFFCRTLAFMNIFWKVNKRNHKYIDIQYLNAIIVKFTNYILYHTKFIRKKFFFLF